MRNLLILLSVVLLSSCVHKQVNEFILTGNLANADGDEIVMQANTSKGYVNLSNIVVNNGKITSRTKLKEPSIIYVTDKTVHKSFTIFGENKPAVMNGDMNNYSKIILKGGEMTNTFEGFKAFNQTQEPQRLAYLKAHSKSLASAGIVFDNYYYQRIEKIKAALATLDPILDSSFYYKYINDRIKTLDRVSVGRKAPNFTLPDIDGNKINLSDYTNKVVIIDFWASWCGPCRGENPNVLRIYNKYHKKGLEILSISLDHSKASWLKAVKEDQLPWKQVCDLKDFEGPVPKLYGILSIPHTFLINKKGVIVATGLRNNKLEAEVKKLIK